MAMISIGAFASNAAADEMLRSRTAFLELVEGKAVTNTIPYYHAPEWEIYAADGTFYYLSRSGELEAAGAWDFFEGRLCKSLSVHFLDRYHVPSNDRYYSRMPCGTVSLADENVLSVVPEASEAMIDRGLNGITIRATIEEPMVLQQVDVPTSADLADENLMQHFSNTDGAVGR